LHSCPCFFLRFFKEIRTGLWGTEERVRGAGSTKSYASDTATTAAVQIGAILRKVMGNSGEPELEFELKNSVKVKKDTESWIEIRRKNTG